MSWRQRRDNYTTNRLYLYPKKTTDRTVASANNICRYRFLPAPRDEHPSSDDAVHPPRQSTSRFAF